MAMHSLFGVLKNNNYVSIMNIHNFLILNAEPLGYSDDAYGILSSIGSVLNKQCDRNDLIALIPEVDVLIVRLGNKIDKEILSKAKKLKVIVTATTGLNHIDLEAADSYGVKVLSLKGERNFLDTLTATAELTWSLLLALYRNLPAAIKHVKNEKWDRDLFKGSQLKGKTLGIIGYGRLGSIVAEYAKVFKMNIVVTDPFVDNVPIDIQKVSLSELLQRSDIVSLHVNYDQSTHRMLGSNEFQKIKIGAVFINTSRSELVDEEAMLKAFDEKKLAGIAIDVLHGEAEKNQDWLKNSMVWKKSLTNNNIIIVPHIGGATYESMEDTEIFMAKKLKKYINSELKL
jgi:D-3-phosphoglycerate dehydrogenase / 2-oxoglutarate reductase